MNFLVIGCGSIGQRHIRNLKKLGHRVSGCEKDPKRARETTKSYGIKVFNDVKKALGENYDGAFVCTPTNLHIPISIELAKKGINLFIEKPLSNNLKGIDSLAAVVNKKRLVALVGCNTRFLPSFKLAKELINRNKIGKVLSVKVECGFYLPSWNLHEDYRGKYSAKKRLGGGVIFDDIHEIDSLHWLFGEVSEVFCFADKISNLKIDTEDVAEILMKFKSGVIAQIHLDYLQPTYRRSYKFIGQSGMITWDYITQDLKLYSKKPNEYKVFENGINAPHETMFIDQTRHFVDCVKGRKRPVKDLVSAKKVLEVALACHKSAQKKEIVYL